ncbi:hypothetical protein EPN42_04785 [bacterium]|nr:MAG: hypothetical protein EPN42_04785 [bacterium]
MSRTAWLRPILDTHPTLERVIVSADPLVPTLWIADQHGWQVVAERQVIDAVTQALSQNLSDDDQVAFTSAGVVTHVEAIDGVGQVTMRHIRGPVSSTIVTIAPIALEGDLGRWGVDPALVQGLYARQRGLVLVGGMSGMASQLSRALFTEVTAHAIDAPAGVIGARPVARAIARTPWLWIACDPRAGVTRIEDAAESLAELAQIVLLDVGGGPGTVEGAIRLVDGGALVIAQVPGDGVQAILERWEAAVPSAERATWTATVGALRAIIATEQITGRFGPETIAEWLPIDATARTTLAREGPSGSAALLSLPGARSREAAITALRVKGRVA